MTKEELLNSIITDLGANYSSSDEDILSDIFDEVVDDALLISNRDQANDIGMHIPVLASNIRKATKAIYLQRGSEDVNSQSLNGLSSTYSGVLEQMEKDIIKTGKRLLI